MLRPLEDVVDRTGLDDLAVLHDDDAVGDLGHHAEVMRDEQHARTAPLLQLADQDEDLLLRGDVERRRRFVGNEQGGIEGQRRGDHHALTLSAGDLVGVDVVELRWIGQMCRGHHFQHAGAACGGIHVRVDAQHLVDLRAAGLHGIERGHRLLEDHRHAGAA